MLCPRIIRIATIAVLREEAGGGGVVVARVHVEQAGGVRYAPRERHFVEERVPRAGRHAELVVVVGLDDRAFPIHDVRDAAADVVPVEEVVVRVRVLLRLRLPLEPLARHNRARRVEDILRLQHVLVHRREQQRRARVVEVRNDLVLHARHALTLRVVRIRRARRERDHRVVRDARRDQPVGQVVAVRARRRHARARLHLLRLVPPRVGHALFRVVRVGHHVAQLAPAPVEHRCGRHAVGARHRVCPGGRRMRLPPGGVVFLVRYAVVKVRRLTLRR